MGGQYDPSSTKQAPQSRSRLLEAASQLRKYLYLASRNDIAEAVSMAKPDDPAQGAANVAKALAENADRKKDTAEISNQAGPTTDKEIDTVATTANDANDPRKKAPPGVEESNAPVTIPESSFPDPIRAVLGLTTGQALTVTTDKKTTVQHLAIIDSGAGISFSGRNAEYVAIFSNLIPTVEFSKCVPYFNIKFIQNIPTGNIANGGNGMQVPMPFLVLDSFVGATRKNSGVQGPGSSTPNAMQSEPVNPPSSKIGQTVSGMELFQAPQTLIRPGINQTSSYKSLRGVQVLDPMQPLMSIESIGIDVMGLSENFMTTQTKVDLSIVLHDRSRLIEISPLVSPSIYPTMRAEITWGWSHPDTSNFTRNPYAKFLNALKSTQVFCVNASSFSNRDSTSISIKLQLTGLGEYSATSTSILTGKYVPYELVRARMNQLFTIIDTSQNNTKDPKAPPQRSVTFVGAHEQSVSLSNWESSDKWVEYEDYGAITSLIRDVSGGQKAADDLVAKYVSILNGLSNPESTTTNNRSATLLSEMKKNINKNDMFQSPYVKDLYKADAVKENGKYSSFFQKVRNDVQVDAATSPGYTPGPDVLPSSATTTLGDLIYRLYTLPMSITGIYDSIRVTTYDFNDHAGMMGSINIGSFPLDTGVANEVLRSNMNVEKALSSLVKLASDPSQAAFGIKVALAQKQEAERKAAAEVTPLNQDEQQAAIEAADRSIQAAFEQQLSDVYKRKNDLLSSSVSYEPKFVPPRLRIHTEVVPVLDGEVVKQVLTVFIYDEANTGLRSTNLLSAIYQSDKGAVRITSKGSDIVTGVCDAKLNADGKTFTVTADRATAKKIITAAVPTLRIGAEGSAIISANYSTQASGDLANLNLIRAYKNSGGASRADTSPGVSADLFVIPASLKLSMIGMPLINRGQTFFVDFGTGTTLDNTYTVTSVNHSIKGGQFTTNVTLNITNQGTIKSVTSMIQTDLNILQQHTAVTTPTPANQVWVGADNEAGLPRFARA